LLLETGSTDRLATYVTGSGSDTLIFRYTVQAGDRSVDLDYQSTGALQLNGATIRSATSVDAILTLPALGGAASIAGQHDLVIDGGAPGERSVPIPGDVTYVPGQNVDRTAGFSAADDSVVIDTRPASPPPPALLPPLVPPLLFDVPGLGAGLPPLGTIFLHNQALAPSFLAQVFSVSSGNGSRVGFLGFGGGDGGVFDASTLSSMFRDPGPRNGAVESFGNHRDGIGEDEDARRGFLGAPTLGQQLDSLRDSELQRTDRLTKAIGEWAEQASVA
jgi:hypothetical protein